MKIRERYAVDRPPDAVWPYIIRPESFAKWNTKISSMDATGESVSYTHLTLPTIYSV